MLFFQTQEAAIFRFAELSTEIRRRKEEEIREFISRNKELNELQTTLKTFSFDTQGEESNTNEVRERNDNENDDERKLEQDRLEFEKKQREEEKKRFKQEMKYQEISILYSLADRLIMDAKYMSTTFRKPIIG